LSHFFLGIVDFCVPFSGFTRRLLQSEHNAEAGS